MPTSLSCDFNFVLVISFTICVANRYKLNKKCRKRQKKVDLNSEDLVLKAQVSQAQVLIMQCTCIGHHI